MVAKPFVESVKAFLREKLPNIRDVTEARIRHKADRLDVMVIGDVSDLDLHSGIHELLDEIYDIPGADDVELDFRVVHCDQKVLDFGGYYTVWSKQKQGAKVE